MYRASTLYLAYNVASLNKAYLDTPADALANLRVSDEATRAMQASRYGLTIEEDAALAWHRPDAIDDATSFYARGHLVA